MIKYEFDNNIDINNEILKLKKNPLFKDYKINSFNQKANKLFEFAPKDYTCLHWNSKQKYQPNINRQKLNIKTCEQ